MDLLDNFLGQMGQLQTVWMPFLISLLIVCIAIWRAMEWRYGGTIARLREECEGLSKKPAPVSIRLPDPERDPSTKALRTLRSARDNAAIALHQGNHHSHRRAFHEAEAAMLSIKRQFGIAPMVIPDTASEAPYKVLAEAYISFIDRFYPLLREGHIEEAKERRDSFKWSWGSG